MARTAVVTAAQDTHMLSLAGLLAALFPGVGPRDLLRLSTVSPGGRQHEWFFWKKNGGNWTSPPGVPSLAGDRLATIIAANVDTEIRFSPLLHASMSANGPATVTSLWVVLPIAALAHSKTTYGLAVDPDSEAAALARLHALKAPPAIVLDEGFRIIGVWTLREPVADLVRAERVLATLARKLGGDLESADVRHMTLPIPGTPCPGVFPTKPITAMVINDRAVMLDDLS